MLRLRGEDADEARRALEELCSRYWFPLYSFARWRNLSPEDAEDATQGYFASLISHGSLETLDRERGRMRSFLVGGMKNFLSRQWRDRNTMKRGRDIKVLSIDSGWAEVQLLQEPRDDGSGEDHFDRDWALAMLEHVMNRLEAYYVKRNRWDIFETLKPALLGDGDYGSQAAASRALGMPEEAVRAQVFQLRARFRRYAEEEVRETVADNRDVRDELLYLGKILARG
ncbi:MAG: sigma-70 family RNA polymerase sigma factor [Akkermansiaceae bacterium]|nr:sigma-70 family RNA polymerase sigma factor [Akkermansiaceae bacterium]